MIYHFVVQYFGWQKATPSLRKLPPPPTDLDLTDAFGQYVSACHLSLSTAQQQVVKEVLPLIMRLGSCNKPPKDWRSFWRATRFSPSDANFILVVRLWYSIAGNYAQQLPDGSWQFASPGYVNLSAVRGMCWLYEEVSTQ